MAVKGTKRKAVTKSADNLFGRKGVASKKVNAEAEELEVPLECEENEKDAEEEAVVETPEEELKREEAKTFAARKKELKGMYIENLKKVATDHGLDVTKKEAMIEQILAHEAKQRADKREHDAKVREIVVMKKGYFESVSAPDLKKLCEAGDIKGQIGKQERVEKLLNQWLADDGVNKALVQMAENARREELCTMDKLSLRGLCDGAGVDPFVKEVMVDKIVSHELNKGCFRKPSLPSESAVQEVPAKGAKKRDMVDDLLAGEADRKRQVEKQKLHDEEINNRIKELKAMSLEQLQKELRKRKMDESGTREVLLKTFSQIREQEEVLAARTAALKGLNKDELKQLVTSLGLTVSKSMDEMTTAVLGHEEKLRNDIKEHEKKVEEAVANIKQELNGKSGKVLQGMCVSKGLKPGGTKENKEERIERLAEEARKNGEIDATVATMARAARRVALDTTDKAELTRLCDNAGLDALVKEVMVERVMLHESEYGCIERPAKKAKK